MNKKTDATDASAQSLDSSESPQGELALRTLAMPKDTNPAGDIFGGWVLAQMDIAGGIVAKKIAKGRTVTIGINAMTFLKPLQVGDVLCCYVDLVKTGRSSITLNIQAWANRQYQDFREKITEGEYTFVAVTSERKTRAIDEPYA